MSSNGTLTRSQELIQKSRERALKQNQQAPPVTPQAVVYKHKAAKEAKKKKGIKKLLGKKKKKKSNDHTIKATGTESASVSSLGSKSSRGSDRKLENGTPSLTAMASIEDSMGLNNFDSARNVEPVQEVEEEEDKSEEVVFETEESKKSAVLELEDVSGGEDASKNGTPDVIETEKKAEEKKTDDKGASDSTPTEPPPRVFRKKHPTLSRSQELILQSRERHKQQQSQDKSEAPINTVHVPPEKTVVVQDDQSESSKFSRCCRKSPKRRDSFEVS